MIFPLMSFCWQMAQRSGRKLGRRKEFVRRAMKAGFGGFRRLHPWAFRCIRTQPFRSFSLEPRSLSWWVAEKGMPTYEMRLK